MAITIDHLPDEVLLQIFEMITFNELYNGVRYTCNRWYQIIRLHFPTPRFLTIDETTKVEDLRKWKHLNMGRRVRRLEVVAVPNHEIYDLLKNIVWMNLRHFILRDISSGFIIPVWSTNFICNILLNAAKLSSVCIRDCVVRGNMNILAETLRQSRVSKFCLHNKTIIIDDCEQFYKLQNMQNFELSCHLTRPEESVTLWRTFVSNNWKSIKVLSLYINDQQNGSNSSDVVRFLISQLVKCKQLEKLQLFGEYSMQTCDLEQLKGLPKLRALKIAISPNTNGEDVARFFQQTFRQSQIRSLKMHWNRWVSKEEIDNLMLLSNKLKYLSTSYKDGCIPGGIVPNILKMIKSQNQPEIIKIRMNSADMMTLLMKAIQNNDRNDSSELSLKFSSNNKNSSIFLSRTMSYVRILPFEKLFAYDFDTNNCSYLYAMKVLKIKT